MHMDDKNEMDSQGANGWFNIPFLPAHAHFHINEFRLIMCVIMVVLIFLG